MSTTSSQSHNAFREVDATPCQLATTLHCVEKCKSGIDKEFSHNLCTSQKSTRNSLIALTVCHKHSKQPVTQVTYCYKSHEDLVLLTAVSGKHKSVHSPVSSYSYSCIMYSHCFHRASWTAFACLESACTHTHHTHIQSTSNNCTIQNMEDMSLFHDFCKRSQNLYSYLQRGSRIFSANQCKLAAVDPI